MIQTERGFVLPVVVALSMLIAALVLSMADTGRRNSRVLRAYQNKLLQDFQVEERTALDAREIVERAAPLNRCVALANQNLTNPNLPELLICESGTPERIASIMIKVGEERVSWSEFRAYPNHCLAAENNTCIEINGNANSVIAVHQHLSLREPLAVDLGQAEAQRTIIVRGEVDLTKGLQINGEGSLLIIAAGEILFNPATLLCNPSSKFLLLSEFGSVVAEAASGAQNNLGHFVSLPEEDLPITIPTELMRSRSVAGYVF